jgi:hypothetical protein
MKVYATQCPFAKRGNLLVPRFPLNARGYLREDAVEYWNTWQGLQTLGCIPNDALDLRRKYGQLIWVLEPNVAPWTPGVMDLLREGLREYNGDTDHLLLLGNPVLMSMMTLYAGEHNNTVRFLQWSNGSYMSLQVEL